MSKRKLEPTPGWCEKARIYLGAYRNILERYGLTKPNDGGGYIAAGALLAEYKAAQEEDHDPFCPITDEELEAARVEFKPRTKSLDDVTPQEWNEAFEAWRTKPQEPRTYTAAEAEKLCRERPEEVEAVGHSGEWAYRYFRFGWFQIKVDKHGSKAWVTCSFFPQDDEPYTIREVTPEPEKPADEDFICPKCGSPYFGRDTKFVNGEVKVFDTVRCHGDSSGGAKRCDWHGVWPPKDHERPMDELPEYIARSIHQSQFSDIQKIDLRIIARKILTEARAVNRGELATAKVEWVTGYGPIIKPGEK